MPFVRTLRVGEQMTINGARIAYAGSGKITLLTRTSFVLEGQTADDAQDIPLGHQPCPRCLAFVEPGAVPEWCTDGRCPMGEPVKAAESA